MVMVWMIFLWVVQQIQKVDYSIKIQMVHVGVLPFPDLKLDRKSEDIDAIFFDADNDNDLDLYIASGGNEYRAGAKEYQDRLYLNDGEGKLSKALDRLPKIVTSAGVIAPADYDQDGDIDLLITGKHTPWEYPNPTSTILLENNDGKFEDITGKKARDLIKIGMVNDAKWVDFDRDGLLDLALAGEWMPFTILKNDGEKFKNITAELGLESSTGWWFSLDAADVDQDGDMDFVLGNLGWNYEYKATVEKPFHIFYYDFDNNGAGDLVLAWHEGDKLLSCAVKETALYSKCLCWEKSLKHTMNLQKQTYMIYMENPIYRMHSIMKQRFSQTLTLKISEMGNFNFMIFQNQLNYRQSTT